MDLTSPRKRSLPFSSTLGPGRPGGSAVGIPGEPSPIFISSSRPLACFICRSMHSFAFSLIVFRSMSKIPITAAKYVAIDTTTTDILKSVIVSDSRARLNSCVPKTVCFAFDWSLDLAVKELRIETHSDEPGWQIQHSHNCKHYDPLIERSRLCGFSQGSRIQELSRCQRNGACSIWTRTQRCLTPSRRLLISSVLSDMRRKSLSSAFFW